MDTQSILSSYPDKSIISAFNDKLNGFIQLGSSTANLESKRNEYHSKNIFKYDEIVSDLKKIVTARDEISNNFIAKRIQFHFSNIAGLRQQLERLNTSNVDDVNTIFHEFDRYIERQYYNHPYTIKISNQDLSQGGLTVIEYYIHEVEEIINSIQQEDYTLNEESVKTVKQVAERLINNKQRYEDAKIVAENWIEKQGNAVSIQVTDRALIFENKAQLHRSGNLWSLNSNRWRFVLGILFGVGGLLTILYFLIIEGTEGMSVGSALLRISMVVICSSFAFFALQQFLDDRKLGEIYTFKSLALRTMDDLLKSYTDQKEKEEILNKALDIVFSEPKLSEKAMVQQKYIDDMIDIVKKKI